MENKDYHKITVAEMAPHVHNFLQNENKVEKITNWLSNWISLSLECGKIKPYDLMPSKADLACHIGVSQGTIQSAYRKLEDAGLVESKQKKGTYIKLPNSDSKLKKLTSKRELTVEILKKYILENSYKEGDVLISTRKMSEIMGISLTTLQFAVNNLVALGFLRKIENKFVVANINFEVEKIQTMTLVEKVAESLRSYIKESLKPGDKLPVNEYLVKKFRVSVKTVHDAIKLLAKEGLLYTRRGRYGTIVLDETADKVKTEQYSYEKFEQKIRQYITNNCEVGEKLPSIKNLAAQYQTSEKTIKKALDNLSEEGYIAFSRGRYGGTFVLDIPQSSGEAYKWLAINTDYMSN